MSKKDCIRTWCKNHEFKGCPPKSGECQTHECVYAKPVVELHEAAEFGKSLMGKVHGHYRIADGRDVQTSTVIKFNNDRTLFETLNTIYHIVSWASEEKKPVLEEKEKKLNPLYHYYLYAKGHYEKSDDIFEDLKQIHAQWCAVSAEHLSTNDVINKLLDLVYVHIKACSDNRLFVEFVSDIHPHESWKVGCKLPGDGSWVTNECYYLRVARKCLSMLMMTGPKDWPFEIGEPDASILPLRIKE